MPPRISKKTAVIEETEIANDDHEGRAALGDGLLRCPAGSCFILSITFEFCWKRAVIPLGLNAGLAFALPEENLDTGFSLFSPMRWLPLILRLPMRCLSKRLFIKSFMVTGLST
jgi:hypothetical protein